MTIPFVFQNQFVNAFVRMYLHTVHCTLIITDVPRVVPNVSFEANITGDTVTIILTWKAPFNNFYPIMNYTVSCSNSPRCPETFTITDNTIRSYTITNLTPNTYYTFSVVATNSIGSGEAGVVNVTTQGEVTVHTYVHTYVTVMQE